VPDLHFSVDTKAGFYGEIEAYDANTGKHTWRQLDSKSMMWGSLLTTAGDLVFGGGTNDVSSLDNGVAFDDTTVSGAVQNNTLVFAVGVTPTKPGKHPINGVFRVGYIEDSENMSESSVPLIADVTGTQ